LENNESLTKFQLFVFFGIPGKVGVNLPFGVYH